jgi:polyhydroxybutyrate depolymerase
MNMIRKLPFYIVALLVLSSCATGAQRQIASASEGPKIPMVPQVLTKPYQGPILVEAEGHRRAAAKVYLPRQFASQESWPLVVLLHGFSGTADQQDQYLTLRYRVSGRGFVLLTPDGTLTPKGTLGADGKDLGGNPFWNATNYCCDFARTGVDDTGYLKKLIETVKLNYNIDPNRVYIFGHSNGGFMANRLACEMGGQIAGIANLAGGSFADPAMCRDPKPVSYLQIHAVDDKTISFDDGLPQYAGGKPTIDQWITKNGCSAKGRPTINKDFVLTIPGNDTSVEAWNECFTERTTMLWTIKGHEDKHHNAHVPIFNLNFTDAVLDFLLAQKLQP